VRGRFRPLSLERPGWRYHSRHSVSNASRRHSPTIEWRVSMDLELKGRKAIVTGATQGIGLRIAQTLADEGVDVAICARTAGNVQATVEALRKKGVNAIGDAVDVSDSAAYTKWIDSAAQRLGGLDIFVSNTTASPTVAGEEGWKL